MSGMYMHGQLNLLSGRLGVGVLDIVRTYVCTCVVFIIVNITIIYTSVYN